MASWTIDWMIATFSGRVPGFADEAAVDLQFVEHGLVQIADRRIAGAEIVERDADAERAQPLQDVEGRPVVAEEYAFGHLELDPVAGQLVAGQRLADDVGKRWQDDLLGADVERDGDRLGPGCGRAAGLVDHPFADHRHQAAFLRDRDEHVGRHEAALRVIPADQRLEADQLLGLGVDQRLEDEMELLGRNRRAEVVFEADAVLLLRLQLGREIAGEAAAGALRLIEREVGLEDQIVDGRAVDRPEGAADRDADADFGLVDHVRLLDRIDDPLGQLLDLFAALRVGNHDREFVAAHAADVAVGADLVDQALGDGAKHRVALGMAEGVVDRLEAVEVEEHDRARHIAGGRRAQRLAEQLADAAAIGQAGEDVDIGEVGQPLLSLADLGDVGADPAEALEASGGIDDRVAGDRDPARAARRLQFHFERIERLPLEQHPAKLGMAAEQRGHRMAEQLRRRACRAGRSCAN